YLFCPQASVSALHRQALLDATDSQTALTNIFTGRPARGIVNRIMREAGPISALAPAFPLAGGAPSRKNNTAATSQTSGQARRSASSINWMQPS
ncbi:oxidoreductase, 2-nitropropane dioxygenase family protein, partial [Pseudomonas syringae pv. actinidiae ICMP 19070]